MLVAAEKGAELIVAVGLPLQSGRVPRERTAPGCRPPFLTRLRIGEILVDAKGVSRLYRPSAGPRPARDPHVGGARLR